MVAATVVVLAALAISIGVTGSGERGRRRRGGERVRSDRVAALP